MKEIVLPEWVWQPVRMLAMYSGTAQIRILHIDTYSWPWLIGAVIVTIPGIVVGLMLR